MHVGGVQKALVSLLWNIRDRYEITLLLFYPEGEYRNELPPEVKVITPSGGYRYLGMIGSRKKVAATFDNLRRAGFAQAQIDTIFAPIGLPIGAVTPAEIAVSTVKDWLAAHPETMERVIFNVFKDEDRTYYEELLS